MDCLGVDTIVAFVEASLASDDIERIEGHVSRCGDCRARLSLALAAAPRSRAAGREATSPDRQGPGRNGLARGATLGRYTVLELLGRGGMGEVYAAYDPELDRKVALKVLRTGHEARDERGRGRLLREAKAIAKLRHPNVVVVHDAGTIDDQVFLAMEHVDGMTLAAWVAERPRGRREILEIFVAAGRGLAAAHAAGLVHRDFKPQNVMVGHDGDVRVTDFGLARAIDGEDPAPSAPSTTIEGETLARAPLTKTGELVGTPLYMAPEQFRAQRVDARTDQFAFSVALYEALYGAHPFASAGLGELMAAVTAGRVQPPPAKRALPPRLRRVLLRGLATKPEDRWPSMQALCAALSSHDPARVRRRWAAGIASVAALAGALAVARAPRRAGSMCLGGPSRLAEAWELPASAAHARRNATRAAFVKVGGPSAAVVWDRAAAIIDRYAEAWLRMYRDTCEATQVRGEQSTKVLDLRMTCLSDRLGRVKALADVFADANADVVGSALSAAGALPTLHHCSDIDSLEAVVPLPEDPGVRAQLDVLKQKLARVKALGDSGQCQAAVLLGRELIAGAEKVGYGPLLAESLNAASTRTGAQCLPADQFIALSRRAALVALTAHDEEAAAEAAIVVGQVEADRTGRVEDARNWIDLAGAILAGMPHRPATLESWRLKALSVVYEKEGNIGKALETCEEDRKLIEKTAGLESMEYAFLVNNIGTFLAEQKRFDEALPYYQQAEQIARRLTGGAHAFLGLPLVNQGEALNALGRFGEARVATERALEVFRQRGSAAFYQATALTLLAEALVGLQHTAEARAKLEEAIRLFGDDRSEYASDARFALARVLWSRPDERARALALARPAADGYRSLAEAKPKLAEVTSWLAARTRRTEPPRLARHERLTAAEPASRPMPAALPAATGDRERRQNTDRP